MAHVSPPTGSRSESAHPIDRFVERERIARGLKPVRVADRRTLIRRAYFDLIGLPPPRAEVAAFERDDSPTAFEKIVDGLLASPRYGERWGRHWMDVVRYADTAGDNADYPIPEIRLYRDYIIDAFNSDLPYDRFIKEQLAGDILAEEGPGELYASRVIATGFLALSRRYATAPFEFMHLTIEDAIDTTGRAFMGMTLRCARCHDHKFDPVTKEDYYALYGFFESTTFPYAGSEEFATKNLPRTGFRPLIPQVEADPVLRSYRGEVAALEARNQPLEKELEAAKQDPEKKQAIETRLKPLRADLAKVRNPGAPPTLPVAYAVVDGRPVDSRLQLRGEPSETGDPVHRRAPRFLAGHAPVNVPAGASGRRELAEWLAQPSHPLTARVMANRIWQHHFGKGLVSTPSNFGIRGETPSHPELLDYLAEKFVEGGWSVKAMHRLILSSQTWQRASVWDANDAAIDPGNRFLWRQDRTRLDAETLRDSILTVAGALNLDRPGRHPFPPIAEWNWTQHNPFKTIYESDHRSVYLMTQRLQRHPYLSLFDAPDANVSTDVRPVSSVPSQALFAMNAPFVRQQSAAFAKRIMEAGRTDIERVGQAVELAFARAPEAGELDRARAFLEASRAELGRIGLNETQAESEVWTGYAKILMTSNEFFYVD